MNGYELIRLIYFKEVVDGTLIDVYINNKFAFKIKYDNGLRYCETSEMFPNQIYKDKEIASSLFYLEEYSFKFA